MNTQIYIIIAVLSFLGFVVSLFIYSKTNKFCRKGENCDLVIGSKYGKIFGIDLSIYGVIYYLINLFLTIIIYFSLFSSYINIVPLVLILTIVLGFIFSLYLLYIQLFVIKKICKKCTVVFFVNLFLLIAVNFLF